jgi:hypothetical protein
MLRRLCQRVLSVGLLAGTLTGCGTAATGSAVQPADGSVATTRTAAGDAGSPLTAAKRIISDIEAAPLARDRAEALFGVTLASVPEQPFPIYKGTVTGVGPFSEVEFREASAVYLMILTVRPGVPLPLGDFLGDVIPAGTPRTLPPDAPADLTESYRVEHAQRETAFEFSGTSKNLLLVAFKQTR